MASASGANFPSHVLWAAGLGNFLDGYSLTIIGVAMAPLRAAWRLAPGEIGLIAGAAVAGSLLGAALGGAVSDRFGRKAIFLLDIAGFVGASALCGVAWNAAVLALFRFVLGMAIGADYPLSSAYLAECAAATHRGKILSLSLGFWVAGAICSALVGVALMGVEPDGWRWMVASGAAPGAIVLALRQKLPESPIWLRQNPTVATANIRMGMRRWALACVPRFCLDVTGYALHLYLPLLLLTLGLHGARQSALEDAGFFSMFVFGWILNVFLVDRFGRMRLQILGFLGAAFGLLVVAAASRYRSEGLYGVAAGLTLYQISNFAGPGITSWILPVELFPTRIRATAQGISTAVAHSGGLLAAVIVPLAIHRFGVAATILALAGTALGGSILTKWLGVETNGITLEPEAWESREAEADEIRAWLPN